MNTYDKALRLIAILVIFIFTTAVRIQCEKIENELNAEEADRSLRTLKYFCDTGDMILNGYVHSTGQHGVYSSYVTFKINKSYNSVDVDNMYTLYGFGTTPFQLGEEYLIFMPNSPDDKYWAFVESRVSYRIFKISEMKGDITVSNGYPISDLTTTTIDDLGDENYDVIIPPLPFKPEHAKLSDFIEVVSDYCK
jgi:hypothetical protein